jgi:ribulose-phosphate 3-epimerase
MPKSKLEIIPAILPRDFTELEDKASLVQGAVKTVQIDICDGQFVPNATWPYKKHDDTFEKLLSEDLGLPFWENLNYEIDLMVNRAEEVAEEWVRAGASRIIIHVEMKGDLAKAISQIKDQVEIGLALNIETDIALIEKYIGDIQFIQCMGIDNIGFQGQSFDDKVIEKIKQIHSKYPELTISVDGGVSLDSAPRLIEAGANRLVVGSAIFNAENSFDAIEAFKKLITIGL